MEPEVEVNVVVPETDKADDVIEQAVIIADKIDDARQQGESNAQMTAMISDEKFEALMEQFRLLNGRFDSVDFRLDNLTDEVATIGTLQVAETIVESTPDELEEINEVVEIIDEPPTVVDEVPDAVSPQTRKTKQKGWV